MLPSLKDVESSFSGRGKYIYAAAIAAIIAIAGYSSHLRGTRQQSSTESPGGMAVTVSRASYRCFADQLNVSGFLAPSEEVLVRPEVDGFRVSEVLVEDGQKVDRNQLLAKLVRADDPKGKLPGAQAVSPVAGIVSVKGARIGALAITRGEPLFRILVDGRVDAEVEVPVAALQKIAPGQEVRIAVPGSGEIRGAVKTKSSWVDPFTQLGRVRVSLESKGGLLPGTFAKLRIFAGESCGMTVPILAILYGQSGAFVQIVVDNKVETRRVKVGFLSGDKAEIRQGVNENDIVVAKAGAFLREGDFVRPVQVDSVSGNALFRASR